MPDSTHPQPQPHSHWLASAPQQTFPTLTDDVSVDVAVVGGGVVGVTAAWLLKRAGLTVALLEARGIGTQATGHADGTATLVPAPGYALLIDRFGLDAARACLRSLQAGLDTIERLVREASLDCDFARTPAWLYERHERERTALRQETDALQRAGLAAQLIEQVDTPFPSKGAIRVDGQAQLDPARYALGLAAAIPGDGSQVFVNTRVIDIDEEPSRCLVRTDRDLVTARHAIVATSLPFLDRGGYFAEAYPRSRVIVTARLGADAKLPEGIWRDLEDPFWLVRMTRDADGPLVLCSGRAFKTGQTDTRAPRVEVESWMRNCLKAGPIEQAWTCEDYESMDGMPLIGPLMRDSARAWVVTGLHGWGGMAGATLAAMLLAERVQGRTPDWAHIYESTRIHAGASARRFLVENLNAAKEWVHDHLAGAADRRRPDELAPGHAAVLAGEAGKIAAYRDTDGRLHAVSATCTHMGCTVAWNEVARSWDCPCHGSRFTVDGRVLHGPAIRRLDTMPCEPPAADAGAAAADTYRRMVDPEAATFETPDAVGMDVRADRATPPPGKAAPLAGAAAADTYRKMVDPEAATFETPDAPGMGVEADQVKPPAGKKPPAS